MINLQAQNTRRYAGRSTLTVAAMCSLAGMAVHGQEAIRESIASEKAAEARRAALDNQVYNLKLGEARLLLEAVFGVEYNDNINYRDTGSLDDVIFEPGANVRLYYPLTERNSLTVAFEGGYRVYLDNTDYNYPVLSPDSQLAWDIYAGDFRFTVYDRVSYDLSPANVGAASAVNRYGGLYNTAGLDVAWDQNDLIVTAGYGYQNFWSGVSDFDYLNRGAHLFQLKADFLVDELWSVGPEASATLNAYDRPVLDDSRGWTAGAFARLRPSPFLTATVRGGYVGIDFDTDPTDVTEDVDDFYVNLRLDHRINPKIRHSIEGGHEYRIGTYSNYEKHWFARYTMNLNVIYRTGLAFGAFYEDGELPPYLYDEPGSITFYTGQEYWRAGVQFALSYQFLENLTGQVSYRFINKEARSGSTDYAQNILRGEVRYRF